MDLEKVIEIFNGRKKMTFDLLKAFFYFVEERKIEKRFRKCQEKLLISHFSKYKFVFNAQFHLNFRFHLQTYAARHSDSQSLVEQVNSKYFYYTRTRGLFRNCYPKERPPSSAGLYSK